MHSWLFPIVVALGTCTSAFQALTGRRLGFGWLNNATYIRVTGAIGVLLGLAVLTYWLVAVGPPATT